MTCNLGPKIAVKNSGIFFSSPKVKEINKMPRQPTANTIKLKCKKSTSERAPKPRKRKFHGNRFTNWTTSKSWIRALARKNFQLRAAKIQLWLHFIVIESWNFSIFNAIVRVRVKISKSNILEWLASRIWKLTNAQMQKGQDYKSN